MRLICGILRLDGATASSEDVRAMASAMTAPGLSPDVSIRPNGPVAFGVLDFAGRGGGVEERDGWIVAADARLDRSNRSPADAFLGAIHEHGPDFPDRTDGDYAVALWDRRSATLWLGRDFMGVRPLAWTCRPGGVLAFASLPKGLHGAGLASASIDPVAYGLKFAQQYFRGGDSGFSDIAYLPAGHSLALSVGHDALPRIHRAYCPDRRQVGRWKGTAQQAADTLRDLLEDAVASRMPADGKVACHLSGGLDSSAITVMAARQARSAGGRVLALSMTTARAIGPERLDERPLIAAILDQERDVSHVVVHDTLPLPGQAEDIDWPGSIVQGADDLMMAHAAAFGARRLLSGVGGDEGATYNGAGLYACLLRQGHLPTLIRELPARARTDGMSVSVAMRERLLMPLLPAGLKRRLGRKTNAADASHGIGRYLDPELRRLVTARMMPAILQSNTAEERALAFADHHIPSRCTYYAIMGARHGIAPSFPLLDRRVVDFALSLPLHLFLSDGFSRQPFRRAMQGILPDSVRLAREKVGLGDQRYTDYASHRDDLIAQAEALRKAPSATSQVFDLEAIRAGLQLLPHPDRARPDGTIDREALAPGVRPWIPLMAVTCLIAAGRGDRAAGGTRADDR